MLPCNMSKEELQFLTCCSFRLRVVDWLNDDWMCHKFVVNFICWFQLLLLDVCLFICLFFVYLFISFVSLSLCLPVSVCLFGAGTQKSAITFCVSISVFFRLVSSFLLREQKTKNKNCVVLTVAVTIAAATF